MVLYVSQTLSQSVQTFKKIVIIKTPFDITTNQKIKHLQQTGKLFILLFFQGKLALFCPCFVFTRYYKKLAVQSKHQKIRIIKMLFDKMTNKKMECMQ